MLVGYLVFPGPHRLKPIQQTLGFVGSAIAAAIAMILGATPSLSKKPKDRPGPYVIIKKAGVMRTQETAKGSVVAELEVEQKIEVIDIVHLEKENRVRAQIVEPPGWITLVNLESNTRWAEHADDYGKMQSPDMQGVFKTATEAGCNPWALFQRTGSANAAPAEVSEGDAWQAMAMLEQTLARADDPSEDVFARNSAKMLRSLLQQLAKSEDKGTLAMAQTIVPDLGRIWANESTRDYCKALLSSPATGEGSGLAISSSAQGLATSSSAQGSASGSAGVGSSGTMAASSSGSGLAGCSSSQSAPAGSSSAAAASSSASAAPAEVSEDDPEVLMAMLESKLDCADDPSEDAASRAEASTLRSILQEVAKSEDPEALAKAQAIYPDLRGIWANETARAQLKDLLSSFTADEGGSANSAAAGSSAEAVGSSSGG